MTTSNNTKTKKIRIAILYGGKSGEHEVSLISAASVIRNLDPERFEIIPVAIDKKGRWKLHDMSMIAQQAGKPLPVFKDTPTVTLPPFVVSDDQSGMELITLNDHEKTNAIDVIFPVMHGTYGEDGCMQGLLELADVPYVGAGVLGSAIGMDKEVAKRLILQAGLPVTPYVSIKKGLWINRSEFWCDRVTKELGLPVFVKPSNSGSSVGISKVSNIDNLISAIEEAFLYDMKVLVEKALDVREIEVSVLENIDPAKAPDSSVVGEIVPTHEFYSYEAKYLDENGAHLMIPAQMEPAKADEARHLASQIFTLLECEGMARVDLFMEKQSGKFVFNEVNTIPGFTTISMYPKLWEATGVSYKELLSRLIDLAISRHQRKNGLKRERN